MVVPAGIALVTVFALDTSAYSAIYSCNCAYKMAIKVPADTVHVTMYTHTHTHTHTTQPE